MKFVVDGYEIDIKAKKCLIRERMNKQDTLSFMNTLCLYLWWTAERDEYKGYDDSSEIYVKEAQKLHDQLDALGYFDDLK